MKMSWCWLNLFFLVFFSLPVPQAAQGRSFEVQGNNFVKDGQPYRIVSGSIHYFRIVPEYWTDRLHKVRACGLNTSEYVSD